MTTSVDCSDDAQWDAYCRGNTTLRCFGHLRPRGVHELPVPNIRQSDSPPRSYSLVISGPPGAGKTALLDLMGVPAEARLPAITPEADPESGLAGLAAYGDLLAARGYPTVLESSVWDTYGPYTLRLLARGFSLDEEFKVKGIRALAAAFQNGGHLTIQVTTNYSTKSRSPGYYRDIDVLFAQHYATAPTTGQIPGDDESAEEMLYNLKRRCAWFFNRASK